MTYGKPVRRFTAVRTIAFAWIPALCAAVYFSSPDASFAEQGLQNCADSFPGSSVQKAPKRGSGGQSDIFLCERSGSTVFFALEYDPEKFAPLWVANQIRDSFGPNGCAARTRKELACYFKQKNADACARGQRSPGDPFHTDADLLKADIDRLSPTTFGGTGHDRGHMAPSSTFSWHACGNYKTYTMANMAAQWSTLNQQLWAQLEAQTLYWGVKEGPVYVVTGPIWTEFPANKFKVIRDGEASMTTVPKPGALLKKSNGKKLSLDIVRPTGFYKLIYRPAGNGQPARAIAFLVPHTKQTGLSFWDFATTVDLVEASSDLSFAIESPLKSASPDLAYWKAESRQAPNKWSPGSDCRGSRLPVAGWDANLSVDERVSICLSERPAP